MASMPGMNGDLYFGDPNEDKLPNWREHVDPDEDSDAPDPPGITLEMAKRHGFDLSDLVEMEDAPGYYDFRNDADGPNDGQDGEDKPADSPDSPESDESASR